MTWSESLMKNYTDGILILHKGKVVYEKYFGELSGRRFHAVMSLTKSFIMWWMTHDEHGANAARGAHGQTIYIDPEAEMVMVRLANHQPHSGF